MFPVNMQWMGTHHRIMHTHDLTLLQELFKGLYGLDKSFSKEGRGGGGGI